MPKFRKKPVVIDAVQWDGTEKSFLDILKLEKPGAHVIRTHDKSIDEGKIKCLVIPTFEGDMLADISDWIIKGVAGEIYPCKPDIFEKTYEPVE